MTRFVIDIPGPNALHYVLNILRQPCHSWTNDVAAQIEAQTVQNPRSLILLDLKDPNRSVLVLQAMARREDREDSHPGRGLVSSIALRDIADQIEAQTKPARIEEPGLWGVVEASSTYVDQRLFYVHTNETGMSSWNAQQGRGSCRWVDLIDPALIRAGVS